MGYGPTFEEGVGARRFFSSTPPSLYKLDLSHLRAPETPRGITMADVTPRELAALVKALPAPARRREIRVSAGVPQSVVAKALGVTRQSVAQWESETDPSDPAAKNLPGYFRILTQLEMASDTPS